jgi:hypothetical protein
LLLKESTQKRPHRTKVVEQRSLHRRRESRLGSIGRLTRSRGSSDLEEGARRLTLRCREDHFHRTSANRGWRVQESPARQNREVRSPDLIWAVDRWRDRWHKSENIGVSAFGGFQRQGLWYRGSAIREVPKANVAVWDPEA